ncbi:MAG: type II toxin-antitoxin system prevent-host-death family antitoxin [Acidobacteria bacterium]|nr:type II toxin-antitoxin system prevent-host-death family antitoxin [Acidobacteriota bacterium]
MIRETTYTGARQNLASLMDQVTDTREPVYIRRRGKEDVALIAASELSGLMETEYLLRSPKNAERLRQAEEEIRAGKGVVMTVEELRERFGLTEE